MELPIWFLIASLFVPRISIFFLYNEGLIPSNNSPFLLDFLGTLLLPRLVVLVCIYLTSGIGVWFVAHAIVWGWLVLFCSDRE
jgi:hypothetical protein